LSFTNPTASRALVLLFAILFVGLSASDQAAYAQTCTATNTATVNKTGWNRDQPVSVYIDPAITGDARRGVEQAFRNWNTANQSNNSGVSYTFTNTAPAAGAYGTFTVSYSPQITGTDGTRVRAQASTTPNANGVTTSASAVIDQVMTNYDAVLETMSHEIGHPAGFGHCGTCAPGDSVMAQVPYDPDDPATFNQAYSRATSPTGCDNQALQQTNYPYCSPPPFSSCTWDWSTCSCYPGTGGGGGGLGGGDESGGGGYYYCTPYYWVYYESWDGGRTWDVVDVSYAGCW
jgi:hypothetical protein